MTRTKASTAAFNILCEDAARTTLDLAHCTLVKTIDALRDAPTRENQESAMLAAQVAGAARRAYIRAVKKSARSAIAT